MILIDIPVVSYETWGISLLRKTEDGYVEDYEHEEEYERTSDLCRTHPYSVNHPHIK